MSLMDKLRYEPGLVVWKIIDRVGVRLQSLH